jgi:ribosomal protein S18 acetylase RimI-like enzyme
MTDPSHSHAILRKAVAADTRAIMALENSCFDDEHERFGAGQVRRLIASGSAVVTVALVDAQIVGWAAGLVKRHATCNSGRIYALAVDPAARGMKVGQLLMEQVIGQLRSRGTVRIYLEVRKDNHAAIALYRKLGFTDFKHLRHYYRPNLHALRMVLK